MKLVFHEDARKDLDELIDYVASRAGARIADQQLARVSTPLQTIERYPRASRYDEVLDVFEAWLPRTRYIAFYRLLPAADLVVILAIIDHARNTPGPTRNLITMRV